jgi:hypothetical protein
MGMGSASRPHRPPLRGGPSDANDPANNPRPALPQSPRETHSRSNSHSESGPPQPVNRPGEPANTSKQWRTTSPRPPFLPETDLPARPIGTTATPWRKTNPTASTPIDGTNPFPPQHNPHNPFSQKRFQQSTRGKSAAHRPAHCPRFSPRDRSPRPIGGDAPSSNKSNPTSIDPNCRTNPFSTQALPHKPNQIKILRQKPRSVPLAHRPRSVPFDSARWLEPASVSDLRGGRAPWSGKPGAAIQERRVQLRRAIRADAPLGRRDEPNSGRDELRSEAIFVAQGC